MKRSSSGEQLCRDIRVVVCLPEQKDIVWRRHAEPRHGWTEAQLDEMLAAFVARVEQLYPSIEFRLVELAPNDYKFMYHGKKGKMDADRIQHNQLTLHDLNACPTVSRSVHIATEVCAKNGHKLSVYQNGMTHTPNGPVMNTINFCSNCGLSLAEVRGDLDARINEAVQQGIKERLAAAVNAKPAPPGGPGMEIVPDLKAKAVVESAS